MPGDLYRFTLGKGSFLRDYKIIEPLGMGGVSEVYVAEKEKKTFALKLVCLNQADGLEMAYRGRQIGMAGIRHLARCYDGFPITIGDNEEMTHYAIVMEYIAGRSYFNMLRTEPDGATKVSYLMSFLEAVSHLHTSHESFIYKGDIITGPFEHRDLKPDNAILTNEGETVLIDFDTFGSKELPANKRYVGSARYVPQELLEEVDYNLNPDNFLKRDKHACYVIAMNVFADNVFNRMTGKNNELELPSMIQKIDPKVVLLEDLLPVSVTSVDTLANILTAARDYLISIPELYSELTDCLI